MAGLQFLLEALENPFLGCFQLLEAATLLGSQLSISLICICLSPSNPILQGPCDYVWTTPIPQDNLSISRSSAESHLQSPSCHVRQTVLGGLGCEHFGGSHYSAYHDRFFRKDGKFDFRFRMLVGLGRNMEWVVGHWDLGVNLMFEIFPLRRWDHVPMLEPTKNQNTTCLPIFGFAKSYE